MSIFYDDLKKVQSVIREGKELLLADAEGNNLFRTDGTVWGYHYDGDTLQDTDRWYRLTHCESGEVYEPSAGLVPVEVQRKIYWARVFELKFGLVQGRHELPVEAYIFDKIDDPTNLNKMTSVAMDWVSTLPKGEMVEIYVTGLTVALVEVLNALKLSDYRGTVYLMHYDSKKGDYFPQVVL